MITADEILLALESLTETQRYRIALFLWELQRLPNYEIHGKTVTVFKEDGITVHARYEFNSHFAPTHLVRQDSHPAPSFVREAK